MRSEVRVSRLTVTLEDFELAARELRGYVVTEKSSEVISSILKIKQSVTYDDVGGLFGVKERIFKVISLSLRPEHALGITRDKIVRKIEAELKTG